MYRLLFLHAGLFPGSKKKSFSLQYAALRVKTRGGLQSKFVIDLCRACSNPPCAEVCEPQALSKRKGGGVRFNDKKCNGCAECLSACPIGYIQLEPSENKAIMCIHCGICAEYCPHEVLGLVEVDAYA